LQIVPARSRVNRYNFSQRRRRSSIQRAVDATAFKSMTISTSQCDTPAFSPIRWCYSMGTSVDLGMWRFGRQCHF